VPAKDCFRFGNPPLDFCNVRVMGVVVAAAVEGDQRAWLVDDSSGLAWVRMAQCDLDLYLPAQLPAVGKLVDFFGQLCLGRAPAASAARGGEGESDEAQAVAPKDEERFVRAHGFCVKEDPSAETLRFLEVVAAYKEHYFAGGWVAALAARPRASRCFLRRKPAATEANLMAALQRAGAEGLALSALGVDFAGAVAPVIERLTEEGAVYCKAGRLYML
jgi:hypothetical protein